MTVIEMGRLFDSQNIELLSVESAQKQQIADDFEKMMHHLQKEIASKPEPTILHCSENGLYRFSSVELKNIFSRIPSSVMAWDISNNHLCRDNIRNTSDYLYKQENKLWAVCEHARNVQVLNIAGNDLYKLPETSFQNMKDKFDMTTRVILGFTDLKLSTMPQIKAIAEMFPNLDEVEFVDATGTPIKSSECRKNALVRYFERCIPNKSNHSPKSITAEF